MNNVQTGSLLPHPHKGARFQLTASSLYFVLSPVPYEKIIPTFQYEFQQTERNQLLLTKEVWSHHKKIDSGSSAFLMLCLFGMESGGWRVAFLEKWNLWEAQRWDFILRKFNAVQETQRPKNSHQMTIQLYELACHSTMDTCRKHVIPVSETKDVITHSKSSHCPPLLSCSL